MSCIWGTLILQEYENISGVQIFKKMTNPLAVVVVVVVIKVVPRHYPGTNLFAPQTLKSSHPGTKTLIRRH